MKNKNVFRTSLKAVAVMVSLGLAATSLHAQVNLNKIKDKVKDKKEDNKSKKETSSSNTNVEVTGNETGEELYQKGNVAYEAGKYSEALAYYEKAENAGYSDGEMKIKMRECRDANDPAKQKEEQDALNTANETMNKLDAMKYKLDPVPDQGITNDFHKANIGKIVFAKSEIPKTETSSSNFTTTFNLGDDIYSRVYMEKSFTNEGNAIGYISQFTDFRYRMTVEGQTFNVLAPTKRDAPADEIDGYPLSKVAEGESKDTWTTYQIAISPKVADVKDYPSKEYRDFWYRMYQLPAGNHKVKLEVVFDIPADEVYKGMYGDGPDQGRKWTTKFGKEKVLAVGEFNVNITEANKIAAGKKICPDMSWLSGTAKLVPDGMAMVTKAKREGETILKVVEFGNDWTYIRNAYGVILSRELPAKALVQDTKTKLCYVVDIKYYQENISSGGSKYGPTTFSRSGGIDNAGETGLFVRECTGL